MPNHLWWTSIKEKGINVIISKMNTMKAASTHYPTLAALTCCPSVEHRSRLVAQLNDASMNFICSCLHELLSNKPCHTCFNLSNSEKEQICDSLKGEKRFFLKLSDKHVSLRKKKKMLASQHGSGFPLMLLAGLIPLITSAIKKLVEKK